MQTSAYSRSGRQLLLGQDNNGLVLLFAINGIMFILLNFLKITYFLSYDDNATAELFFRKQILNWFVLPSDPDMFFTRPWTLLTYMFTHMQIWAFLSNMLWLWAFGYILQDLSGNNKLIPVYLYGGFIGGLVFLLSVNLVPAFQRNLEFMPNLMGAGAAVMAIAVATTTLTPDYRIFPLLNGGIPLWVLTLIFVAIDFAFIASANGGIALAHLTGAAIGFIYIHQLRKGRDIGAWMTSLVQWIDDLFNPEKKHRSEKRKDQLYYRSNKKPYTKTPLLTQQKLDAILDKINQHGYEMLTEEEKTFLKRASEEEL